MKLFLIFMLALAGIAQAGTITITISGGDEPRIAAAYGSLMGLNRPATIPEIQGFVTLWMERTTHDYERSKAQPQPLGVAKDAHAQQEAGTNKPPTNPTPTPKKK